MSSETKPSVSGQKIIERFQRARQRVDQLRSETNSADVELTNATDELGKWLVPSDAKPGEKFAIWGRDMRDQECLFEVHAPTEKYGRYFVKIRSR